MSLTSIFGLFILGLLAGYFSGLVGVGGGVIIVPALVFFFGFSQHAAQGTTLGLLVPPVGILAAYHYYQKGLIDVRTSLIICAGFVLGGYLGGKAAIGISESMLRKIFGLTLVVLGIKMVLQELK
jgi:uncharacterized membrane protein YfcA